MEPKERIIVALDVDDLYKAAALVNELGPFVGGFKVGLQLLTSQGAPRVVETVKKKGAKLLFDGKFHDIPNTVAGAAKAVAKMGVDMFTVHASGGVDMMREAVSNRGNSDVLAVTILTSLSAKDLWELGYVSNWQAEPWERFFQTINDRYIPGLVIDMARAAKEAGVQGIVCSPKEVRTLASSEELEGLYFVTPGIRPGWAAAGDQKRIASPADAVRDGAKYLVIGRPITSPPPEIGSPVEAAKRIAEEISGL